MHNLCIDTIRTDEKVEIFCRSWFGIHANSVTANKKIFNPVCVERE
jgi:hypothetical protein